MGTTVKWHTCNNATRTYFGRGLLPAASPEVKQSAAAENGSRIGSLHVQGKSAAGRCKTPWISEVRGFPSCALFQPSDSPLFVNSWHWFCCSWQLPFSVVRFFLQFIQACLRYSKHKLSFVRQQLTLIFGSYSENNCPVSVAWISDVRFFWLYSACFTPSTKSRLFLDSWHRVLSFRTRYITAPFLLSMSSDSLDLLGCVIPKSCSTLSYGVDLHMTRFLAFCRLELPVLSLLKLIQTKD